MVVSPDEIIWVVFLWGSLISRASSLNLRINQISIKYFTSNLSALLETMGSWEQQSGRKIFMWEKRRDIISRGSFLMTSVYTEQCALTWCGNDSIGIGYVMSTRLLYITTEQKMGKTQRTYFGNIWYNLVWLSWCDIGKQSTPS